MLYFTFGYWNTCHGDPAKKEYIKPDIENEPEISGVILCSNTGIKPNTMSLILRHTSITNCAMLRTRLFYDLAFRA